jgi:hypothetical protein
MRIKTIFRRYEIRENRDQSIIFGIFYKILLSNKNCYLYYSSIIFSFIAAVVSFCPQIPSVHRSLIVGRVVFIIF